MPKTHRQRHMISNRPKVDSSGILRTHMSPGFESKSWAVRVVLSGYLIAVMKKKPRFHVLLAPRSLCSFVPRDHVVVWKPQCVSFVITGESWFQRTRRPVTLGNAPSHWETVYEEKALCLAVRLFSYHYPVPPFYSRLFGCKGKQYNKNISQSLAT